MKKITSLIEYYAMSSRDYNTKINDPAGYKFATGILLELCMKYTKWAFNCIAKVKPVQSRNDSGLHRAAFNATLISLESDKSQDKHKILCKIYKSDKSNNTIAIDYNAIVDGYYDIIASIIDDTVYYLSLYDVYRYQEGMGNRCITKGGKFIEVDANYFIEYARAKAKMDPEDIARYNAEYKKYIANSTTTVNAPRRLVKIGESKKYNGKAIRQLLEGIRSVTGINNRMFDKKVLRIINEHLYNDNYDNLKFEIIAWLQTYDPFEFEYLCDFVALQIDVRHIVEYLAQEFNVSVKLLCNALLNPENYEMVQWIADVCNTGQYENDIDYVDDDLKVIGKNSILDILKNMI